MKKKPSIRDIAGYFNISKTTVSFILNGKAKEYRISDDLSKKVLDFVAEHKFEPNLLAQSLSTGKTMLIGFMVERISDYFFSQVAYHFEKIALTHGYRVLYCSSENNEERGREAVQLFRKRQVDACVITPVQGISDDISELVKDKTPVTLFDRYLPGVQTNYVGPDNYNDSFAAGVFLAKQGFTNIAFVGGNPSGTHMHDRERGYADAMRERGLPVLVKCIADDMSPALVVEEIRAFIAENNQLDSVFFASDNLALQGIKAVKMLGKQVPGHIGLMAFGDHDMFDAYNPGITAVAHSFEVIASALFESLYTSLIEKEKSASFSKKFISGEIVERQSTLHQ